MPTELGRLFTYSALLIQTYMNFRSVAYLRSVLTVALNIYAVTVALYKCAVTVALNIYAVTVALYIYAVTVALNI